MKLVALTIPDDAEQLAGWLEGQLVGLDLAALTAELTAVHGPSAEAPALADLLGERRDAVLAEGLSALPEGRLGQLLRTPALLPELQELVLTEGGPYWDNLPRTAEVERAAERGRRQPVERRPTRSSRWWRQPAVVSLATAALVLLAVGLGRWLTPPEEPKTRVVVVSPPPPPAPVQGWGWDRAGALPAEGSAKIYLNALADAAEQWFKKRPDTPAALARRLNEFRQGCTTLIFASHEPLPPRDREWLTERCRVWTGRIDRQLSDLEAGGDVNEVRGRSDEMVRQIVQALRERAAKV